ncbi:MAG: glycosyltransferase family 2 protein [Nitrospinota bacterium]|nr:MAG: glycosyltransferase family 2 protein [Nitrospinota bacterium]
MREAAHKLIASLRANHTPVLSVVIPAYNEEKRLGPTLAGCMEFLDREGIPHEIVVVDDGSRDQTASLVNTFSQRHPHIRLISLERNRGKGAAVRTGVFAAQGALILLNDADGATPIAELFRLLAEMALTGCEVVIGSRALDSPDTHVEKKLYRFLLGRIFALLVNLLVVPHIKDTQCGFKLFTRSAAQQIFSYQTLDGFSFDVEVLYLAHKLGYRVREVAVNWHDVAGSKLNLLIDPLHMGWDLLGIRFRHRSLPPPLPSPKSK